MLRLIKHLLKQSIERAGIKRQVEATLVCREFDKIIIELLGKEAENRIRATYLKNQTLVVMTLNAVLAQECQIHQEEIIRKINAQLKKELVKEIRIQIR